MHETIILWSVDGSEVSEVWRGSPDQWIDDNQGDELIAEAVGRLRGGEATVELGGGAGAGFRASLVVDAEPEGAEPECDPFAADPFDFPVSALPAIFGVLAVLAFFAHAATAGRARVNVRCDRGGETVDLQLRKDALVLTSAGLLVVPGKGPSFVATSCQEVGR